jgi:hypothetical protein
MAHHRLGHGEEARGCYDRAVRWLREQKSLNGQYVKEPAGFRGEAEALLAEPVGELPAKSSRVNDSQPLSRLARPRSRKKSRVLVRFVRRIRSV